MHIEYDVTEQDFLDAQRLVRRMSNSGFMGWAEFASPFLGFVLAAFVIYLLVTKSVSVLLVLGLGVESASFVGHPILPMKQHCMQADLPHS